MKHIYSILLLFALCIGFTSNAQQGFSRLLRSQQPFTTYVISKACLLQTVDSAFLAIYNVNDTAGGTDLLLLKMDFNGNPLWQKKIEIPTNMETFLDAVQMPDSTINVLCTYDEPGFIYDEEVFIVRVDLNGNLLNTNYVTNSGICCWDISDGRLLLDNSGRLMLTHLSFGISSSFGLVRVLSPTYNYIYGGNDGTALYHSKLFQDVDNNYMSFGHEGLTGQKRASLVKRNNLFTFQFQKFFRHGATATSKATIADDVIRNGNNYVLLMHFEDTNALNNLYIIKTNLAGDSLSSVRLINESVPFGIYEIGNDGYIIAVSTFDAGTYKNLELIKMDTAFNITARQKYGYKYFNEHLYSFKVASDSCYLLAASADSGTTRNIHVLKVKPNLCVDPSASYAVDYNTGYSGNVAAILLHNTSDYGVIDSVNTITTIDFGDGSPSQNWNSDTISHVYANQGNYTITLTVTTPCGSSTYTQNVTVPCTGQPFAYFLSQNLLTVTVNYNYPSTIYSWSFGDGAIASTQSAQHTYALPGTYNLCVTVTNNCGTISICDSVTVTCSLPVIALPADTQACAGTTLVLNAGNNGSSYIWSNGTTAQQNPVTIAGTYTVTVTNVCGESSTATINVQFPALPLINIGPDTIVCLNDLVQVTNTAGTGYSNSWYIDHVWQGFGSSFYFSQSSLGLYEVTLVADNNGCLDSASRFFTVSPALFCDTTTYCIPTYTTGTAQGDYVKRVGIGTINNITGGTGQPAYVDYTNITTTLNAGQSVTLTLEFNEVNPMYYRIWIDYNQDGIFSGSEVLSQNAVNSGVSTIFTTLSANAYGGPTRMRVRCANSTSTNMDPCASYDYGQTEDYTIIIQNGTGAPIALFDADTTHIYINDAVNFFDQSYNNPTAWEWTFDGAATPSSTSKNPAGIIYPTPGCYAVTLKAINANGMSFKTDTCYINVDLSLITMEESSSKKFSISPNPFNNEFTLQYDIAENAVAIVTDIAGRQVMSAELVADEHERLFNLSSLAPGAYNLSVVSNNRTIRTTKLIKLY